MEPLVSVCIITYNSSSTIIQTLESIKAQTYNKIELVISDDCSKDDTINIINNWADQNKTRFTTIKVIAAEKNAGTACNLHTSIINSTGEWIKILAGDDLLSPQCIETFVNTTMENPQIQFFTCKVKAFCEDSSFDLRKIQVFYNHLNKLQHKSKSAKKRLSRYKLIYPGPEWFFSRKLYVETGGINLKYTMLDETPFTFKVARSGYEIIPVDKELVFYRVSNTSASHSNLSPVRRLYQQQDYDFYIENQLPQLKKHFMFFEILDQQLNYFIMKQQVKKFDKTGIYDTKMNKLQFLSPVTFLYKISERLELYKLRK